MATKPEKSTKGTSKSGKDAARAAEKKRLPRASRRTRTKTMNKTKRSTMIGKRTKKRRQKSGIPISMSSICLSQRSKSLLAKKARKKTILSSRTTSSKISSTKKDSTTKRTISDLCSHLDVFSDGYRAAAAADSPLK